MARSLLFVGFIIILAGCATTNLDQYAGNRPELDIFTYFHGKTIGWGIVQDRSGNLIRQFRVDIDGSVSADGKLVLKEAFDWSDGEKSTRIWTIERVDEHHFQGTAADVVGTATGTAYGNVLNWRYDLNLTAGDRMWKIHFDDWMFLHNEDVLINRAAMSKFGFHVGDVTIVFNKPGSAK